LGVALIYLFYRKIKTKDESNNSKIFEPVIFNDTIRFLSTKNHLKTNQLTFPNVRTAYKEKENEVAALLHHYHVKPEKLQIYLRAFKKEGVLELWIKNKEEQCFQFAKSYAICTSSGKLGPKRKEGDYQVPEGYYQIDRLNPKSKYFLSLHVNYPNFSDKIFADPIKPGSLIFVHGNCVSIGCLPITDEKIKELYILCAEAMGNGQVNIPITIFPAMLESKTFDKLSNENKGNTEFLNLWADLRTGYDYFNIYRTLPEIIFLDNGRATVRID
jgi:murein L,D-transpeptidase YafK